MSSNPKIDRVLARFEPGRRDALRKIAVGSAVYVAPVVASFSMESLGGVAQAQGNNQTVVQQVPATSGWTVAAMFGALTAAAAVLLRRRRDPK
jgi:MYXO-CTERM domain-containing protein